MKGKYKFIRWRYNAGFKKNIYIFNTYFLYEKSRSSEGERED